MGGWSDDHDDGDAGDAGNNTDQSATTTAPSSTLAQLQALVAETQAIQLKTSGKSEKQIKLDLEKAKLLKKRKAKGTKAHVPVIIEPKLDTVMSTTAGNDNTVNTVRYKNVDGDEDVVAKATGDDVVFFRPFYLWWQGEDASTMKKDYSREQQLLKDYYTQVDNDDESNNNNNNKNDDDDGDNDDGLLDNEDEDDDDQDPYELYQEAINNQPEQVIRYFNSGLSLHQQPSAENIDQFRKSSKSHEMQRFTNQSGVWLLHDVPKCKGCQEPLSLECQILPTLLSELKPDEFELIYHRARFSPNPTPKSSINHDQDGDNAKKKARAAAAKKEKELLEKKFDFDWGIVNIYSCLNMCSPDEYMTGFCLVQPGL